MVGARAMRARVHLGQDLPDSLHRVLRARILEVDPHLVQLRRGLGVLLLDRGHDQ